MVLYFSQVRGYQIRRNDIETDSSGMHLRVRLGMVHIYGVFVDRRHLPGVVRRCIGIKSVPPISEHDAESWGVSCPRRSLHLLIFQERLSFTIDLLLQYVFSMRRSTDMRHLSSEKDTISSIPTCGYTKQSPPAKISDHDTPTHIRRAHSA